MDDFNSTVDFTDSLKGEFDFYHFYLSMHHIIGLFLYPIVCLIGLPANIIGLAVWSRKEMRSSTSILLISLSITDLAKILNDLLYFVTLLLKEKSHNDLDLLTCLYPYAHYVRNVSVMATSWFTVFLAIERYIFVCHAVKAKFICTVINAIIISICFGIASLLLPLPYLMKYNYVTTTYKNITNSTEHFLEISDLWHNPIFEEAFTWLYYIIQSAIPVVLLIVFSTFIIFRLNGSRLQKGTRRATAAIVMVIIAYVFCHFPDSILSAVYKPDSSEASYLIKGIRELTDLLLLLNTTTNFVLYCAFNRLFLKTLRKMCRLRVDSVSTKKEYIALATMSKRKESNIF